MDKRTQAKEKRKRLRKTLADVVKENHEGRFTSVKIGDPIPPDDQLLSLVRVRSRIAVDQTAADQIIHDVIKQADMVERVFHDFQLTLAGEQVEAPMIYEGTRVKGRWDHFKTWLYWEAKPEPRSLLSRIKVWLRKRYPVKYEPFKYTGTCTYQVAYPWLKLPKVLPGTIGVLVSIRQNGPETEYKTMAVQGEN